MVVIQRNERKKTPATILFRFCREKNCGRNYITYTLDYLSQPYLHLFSEAEVQITFQIKKWAMNTYLENRSNSKSEYLVIANCLVDAFMPLDRRLNEEM